MTDSLQIYNQQCTHPNLNTRAHYHLCPLDQNHHSPPTSSIVEDSQFKVVGRIGIVQYGMVLNY